MMENESLRSSKNTTVIFVSLLFVAALVWAIVASVIAAKHSKAFKQLTDEMTQLRADTEARILEADRRMAEAEKLRRVALEWTRQHQLQVQAELQRKAAEAAKAAAAKSAKPAPKKTTKSSVTTRRTSAAR